MNDLTSLKNEKKNIKIIFKELNQNFLNYFKKLNKKENIEQLKNKNINKNFFFFLNFILKKNFFFLKKNKIYNKSKFARNKQTYRTGVFLCI
jgi:hypothetical protein